MVVWLEAVVAAVMGAAALSFVQLDVDRAGGSVGLLGRSRCHRCATGLRAWEVLPIAGFCYCAVGAGVVGLRFLAVTLSGKSAWAWFWAGTVVLLGPVVWLPVVLVAPLAVLLLLRSPVCAAGRALLAGLLPLVGVALLTLGFVGLLEGRWAVYGAGGLLGAVALFAGAAAARGAAVSAPVSSG